MNTPMPPRAEPSLSANIYCAARLDEVIHQVIAPFWQENCRAGADKAYLRMLRYTRRGEHLKIRIHAPEPLSSELGASLQMVVTSYFDAIAAEPSVLPTERILATAMPIDVEDELPSEYPDRSFLWTQHKRSCVEYGGKPLLDDDIYIERMVRCHAEAAERVLVALKPNSQGTVPFHVRLNTLLKSVMIAISVPRWSAEKRCAYFAYHRDWLTRFSLAQSSECPHMVTERFARFDTSLQRLGPQLEVYRNAADAQWCRPPNAAVPIEAIAPWPAAIEDLYRHLAPLANDPRQQIDPFAPEPMFSALFKVFHLLANLLGLKPHDETFAHHLLLSISGGAENHAFAVHPPLVTAYQTAYQGTIT
jgi:Lantibiotic biosynthesis dehydratase C-term